MRHQDRCPSRTGTPCDFQRRDDFGDVQQAAWTTRTAAELALSGVVTDCRGQHIPRPGPLVVESGRGYRCGRIGRERAVHLDCGCVVAHDAKPATRDGANVRCAKPTDVGVVPVAVPCLPIGHVYQRRRGDGRGRPGTGTGLLETSWEQPTPGCGLPASPLFAGHCCSWVVTGCWNEYRC